MKLWHWRDLFTNDETGKLSETKLWSNIGKGAMTFGFLWSVIHAGSTDWLWLTFGAVIAGHAIANKIVDKEKDNSK